LREPPIAGLAILKLALVPSLSIIVPTVGRASLFVTLNALVNQLAAGDEVLVIGDGQQPFASILCERFGVTYHTGPRTMRWGNAQRDFGIELARGDYIAFCDDDDVFTLGALDAMRRQADGRPVLFRMQHPTGLLWRDREIRQGNVGTPMFLAPNDARLGTWADSPDQYAADLWFISNTVSNCGGVVKWSEEIVCKCRTT